MNLPSLAKNVSAYLVALLLLVATVVIVVGLVRETVARRRIQLIITDIADTPDFPASVTAGLSSLLRAQIRRRMISPTTPPGGALGVVANDISLGLVTLDRISTGDLTTIERDILMAPKKELLSKARGDLAAVAGGIRAVAPSQAEGLYGAVIAALPRQRGIVITSTPLARQVDGLPQTGLTVDIGTIGRAPEASATLWSESAGRNDPPGPLLLRTQLFELLPDAADWITLHLIGTLAVDGVSRARASMWRRKSEAKRLAQTAALRDILTAQLAGHLMNRLSGSRPATALAFADQASEDAQSALAALPAYHRPRFILGNIQDHRGKCFRRLALGLETMSGSASPTASVYADSADRAFERAEDDYRQAEGLLNDLAAPGAKKGLAAHAREESARVRVRRIKAALSGPRSLRTLDEVDQYTRCEPPDFNTQYNEACLFAVASNVAEMAGRGEAGARYRAEAWASLAQALARKRDLGQTALADAELVRGLSLEHLKVFVDELTTQCHEHPNIRSAELSARLVATAKAFSRPPTLHRTRAPASYR